MQLMVIGFARELQDLFHGLCLENQDLGHPRQTRMADNCEEQIQVRPNSVYNDPLYHHIATKLFFATSRPSTEEWFYSPLFDMAHMRSLLVRHLSVECHFLGAEGSRSSPQAAGSTPPGWRVEQSLVLTTEVCLPVSL